MNPDATIMHDVMHRLVNSTSHDNARCRTAAKRYRYLHYRQTNHAQNPITSSSLAHPANKPKAQYTAMAICTAKAANRTMTAIGLREIRCTSD